MAVAVAGVVDVVVTGVVGVGAVAPDGPDVDERDVDDVDVAGVVAPVTGRVDGVVAGAVLAAGCVELPQAATTGASAATTATAVTRRRLVDIGRFMASKITAARTVTAHVHTDAAGYVGVHGPSVAVSYLASISSAPGGRASGSRWVTAMAWCVSRSPSESPTLGCQPRV